MAPQPGYSYTDQAVRLFQIEGNSTETDNEKLQQNKANIQESITAAGIAI